MQNQATVYRFMLGYIKMLLADLPEEELDKQPFAGANTPRWILTHLAICTDYAARALGGTRECPKEWHTAYGPGSVPDAEGIPKPTKEELMAALEKGHARVIELALAAKPEVLEAPHNVEFLKPTPLKTVSDFVTHLMTSHEAGHLGQLSYWRRATGRPALF